MGLGKKKRKGIPDPKVGGRGKKFGPSYPNSKKEKEKPNESFPLAILGEKRKGEKEKDGAAKNIHRKKKMKQKLPF